MPKLNILPDIKDIKHFLSAGTDKSFNAESNRIRENIIANMFNLNINDDPEYFNDKTYGNNWLQITDKFTACVSSLCEEQFDNIKIKHMGGMSFNYDFLLSYYKNETIVKKVKLEFKHNNSDVSNLVQFLELYDKDCKYVYDICETSYAEYYYDNYLNKYLQTDQELSIIVKPDKETYLKNVYDINYKHSFFSSLYNRKTNNTKEKRAVANESVKNYIKEFHSSFKFQKVADKVKESQTNKVFLLWDCVNFHTQVVDSNLLVIDSIKKVDNLYFDVNCLNFNYNIRIRLNWGNNNGLANPRWKFSFINK